MPNFEIIKGEDNGNPPDTLREMYPKVNRNFDKTKQEFEAQEARIDNILNEPDPNKDLELVDIRTPAAEYTPEGTIDVAGDMTRDMQRRQIAHEAKNATDGTPPHGMGKAAAEDYEEGTWTPVLEGNSVSGVNTYSSQVGFYTLIGKVCHYEFRVTLTEKDTDMAGNLRISGLPFTSNSANNRRFSGNIGLLAHFIRAVSRPYTTTYISNNSSSVLLYNTGDDSSITLVSTSQLTDSTDIVISGSYII